MTAPTSRRNHFVIISFNDAPTPSPGRRPAAPMVAELAEYFYYTSRSGGSRADVAFVSSPSRDWVRELRFARGLLSRLEKKLREPTSPRSGYRRGKPYRVQFSFSFMRSRDVCASPYPEFNSEYGGANTVTLRENARKRIFHGSDDTPRCYSRCCQSRVGRCVSNDVRIRCESLP